MIAMPSNARLLALTFAAAVVVAIGCNASEDSGSTTPAPTPPAAPAATTSKATPKPADTTTGHAMTDKERQRVGKVEGGLGVTRITPRQGSNTIELPADFPTDVPVHPDATPTSYISAKSGRKVTTLVAANITPETVRSYYPGALEDQGWSVKTDGAGSEMMIVTASKDRRKISVAISDESGKTTIKLIEGRQ